MNELLALAAARTVAFCRVRIVQDNADTKKGSTREGTRTGGAKDVDLDAAVERDVDPGMLGNPVHDAVSALPLTGLMRGGAVVAEMLLIDRRPVHEAMPRLAGEGFLERLRGGGFTAPSFSTADAVGAIESRDAIEGPAARLAAEHGA